MAVVLAAGTGTAAAIGTDQHAGPQGDGTSITPVGWRVTPVGQQPPGSILTRVNPANAPLATAIAKQSFNLEDQANMQLLNEAIWQSVKGAGSTMPPAQHNVIDPAAYTGEG